MEDSDKISWHFDPSLSATLESNKSRDPYSNSATPSPTSMMATAIDLSRKSAQLPAVFAYNIEQLENEPDIPVKTRKGDEEESDCVDSCLYVGIVQVRAKDGNCSGDVMSDLHVDIGDVFQHINTEVHCKAHATNVEHTGRILVKKIKNALAGQDLEDKKVNRIGYVPKCYLAKVPSLLGEATGAVTINQSTSPNISHNLAPTNEEGKIKIDQVFPDIATKPQEGIRLKSRKDDVAISHNLQLPSHRPTEAKASTAKMLADFSPHETNTNAIAANSQSSRPSFNPKRLQPQKQANPASIVSTPVDPISNPSHLLHNPKNLLLPNTSSAQQKNLMVPPIFNGGVQLDNNVPGFLGALNPFSFPNSFPFLLHLLKNMPQFQQAAFTAAVMHRYQLMQMDSSATHSDSSRLMTSPLNRWSSDAAESFLAHDNSPRLPDCDENFNFDNPANVFASGLLSEGSLCPPPASKAEPLFPSAYSSISFPAANSSTVSSSKNFFSGAAKLCNLSPFPSSSLPQSSQQTHNPGHQFHHPSIHPLKKHGRGRPPYRSVELIVGMGVFEHGRFKKLTVRNKFGIGGKEAINVRCTAVAKEIEAAATHQHKLVNKLITNVDFTLVFPDGTPVKYLPGTSEPFVLKKYKEMRNDSWIRLRLFLCPTKHLIQANATSTISTSTAAPHLDVANPIQTDRN